MAQPAQQRHRLRCAAEVHEADGAGVEAAAGQRHSQNHFVTFLYNFACFRGCKACTAPAVPGASAHS